MPTTLETLVRKMRSAQKRYLLERTQSALADKNKYERMVDAELAKLDDESEKVTGRQDALGTFFERE